ncbi:MAG: uracil-DNA glycosylase [Oscillospiraceae bacterium]|nr:uracil-DNA glycosylase [Oscillospiraceae bacterium]
MEKYMKRAVELAELAGSMGEIPVGAVVVKRETGEIVAEGYNRRESDKNALAHAELIAINEACKKLGGWRLIGCDLYVTLEPCPMCCGAIINSRVERVIYGADDMKAGSVFSLQQMFELPYNHKPEIIRGVMSEECGELLSSFFRRIRKIQKYIGAEMVNFENEWDELLKDEFQKDYYQNLRKFLIKEYKTQTIYPDMYDIYNAMKYTSYQDVKVVILGQDPYHEPNQAHGLSFSVKKGVEPPPSLKNIFKEINDELGIDNSGKHGELTNWAKSGVLLLNTVLTVRRGMANSHKDKGWEHFTDRVISLLNEREKPVVFLLWGNNAKAKRKLITGRQHLVLASAHPSPLSAYHGFFGCGHFAETNKFLEANGMEPVNWSID